MLKAMSFAEFVQIEQHPLLPSFDNFAPVQIVYRQIGYPRGPAPKYTIRDNPRPVVADGYNGVENFALKIAKGEYGDLPNVGEDKEEEAWLGITISRQSYIVLSLRPEEDDWDFTVNQHAITIGTFFDPGNPPLEYAAIRYVTPSGVFNIPQPDCKVVFFSAKPRFGSKEIPYIQKMNYIVDVEGRTTKLLDPDIRHPGNGSS